MLLLVIGWLRYSGKFRLTDFTGDVLSGQWIGTYTYKDQTRRVEIRFLKSDTGLRAEIHTATQEGRVIQHAKRVHLDDVTVQLQTEEITTSHDRSKNWRPETWTCKFTGDGTIDVTITDRAKSGDERIVAKTKLTQA